MDPHPGAGCLVSLIWSVPYLLPNFLRRNQTDQFNTSKLPLDVRESQEGSDPRYVA